MKSNPQNQRVLIQKNKFFRSLILVSVMLISTHEASAFSFSGNFVADDNYFLTSIPVQETSTVTFESTSYASPNGGLVPYLTLFDPSDTRFAESDSNFISYPNNLDFLFTKVLNPGTYTLLITQFDNKYAGNQLLDPIQLTKSGNFTANSNTGCTQFCDPVTGQPRTGQWSLNITPVPLSTVAEPEIIALIGLGLVGMFISRRRSA
jgi:hypothetical protein